MEPEPDAVFAPMTGGGVRVHLPEDLRAALADLCDQLEGLVRAGHAADDPAVARLFPAAYPDDPLRELEFEQLAGDQLLQGRLASLRSMRETLPADELDGEHARAWLRTLNDLRLVLGSRLEVTEESRREDFGDDETGGGAFELYLLLGEVQSLLLFALDPSIEEPDGEG